jgi:PAS domain-containing protein
MNLLREDPATIETNKSFFAKLPDKTNESLEQRLDPLALSLDERGMIQDCSKSFEKQFGFRRSDLVWQPVSKLFPQLVGVELIKAGEVNPLLNYLCRCGQLYEAQNRHGDTLSCNLSFVRIEYNGKRFLRLMVRPLGGVQA